MIKIKWLKKPNKTLKLQVDDHGLVCPDHLKLSGVTPDESLQ